MSMVSETNAFIRSAKGWLTDDDGPALQALKMLAKAADSEDKAGGVRGATMGQYGLTYRNLLTRKPAAEPAPDDEDDLS
jgi:hypothetical protein